MDAGSTIVPCQPARGYCLYHRVRTRICPAPLPFAACRFYAFCLLWFWARSPVSAAWSGAFSPRHAIHRYSFRLLCTACNPSLYRHALLTILTDLYSAFGSHSAYTARRPIPLPPCTDLRLRIRVCLLARRSFCMHLYPTLLNACLAGAAAAVLLVRAYVGTFCLVLL